MQLLEETKITLWFDRITSMTITLESNPELLGASYIKALVVKVRNYSTEVESYLQEINILRRNAQKQCNLRESEIKLEISSLLSNDPDVVRMSSAQDRRARAEHLLSDKYKDLYSIQNALQDLDNVEVVVKNKLKELKDIAQELKLLRSLIKDSMDIGSFYGQETAFDSPHSLLPPGRSLVDRNSHDDMFDMNSNTRGKKRVSEDPEAEELRETLKNKFS
jgi:hypothetical protein